MQIKKILIFFIVFIFIILAIFIYIWQKYEVIKSNQKLESLYYHKQKLEQTKKELILKKESLLDKERIRKIAKDNLKMQDLKAKNIRILKIKDEK